MEGIEDLLKMREYFNSGITLPYAFRKQQLIKLKDAVLRYEKPLQDALQKDLHKSPEESWATETGFLITELNNTLKHFKSWMHKDLVPTNLLNLPSKSYILKEPLGVVLIIGPWNYPLQLLLTPLVGAIAAGNTAVIKASEFAPATAAVIKKMINETFEPSYVLFKEGYGATVVPSMMNHFSFDHVFYTGSTVIGRLVYKMAAERLVPVTLELGGKSPCIVEADANIKVAARRIAMTSFSNAGQMCVAPDYVLAHVSIKEKLISELKTAILSFYGEDASQGYNFGRIVNEKQFDRLAAYLQQGKILHGGKTSKAELFIEPTLMEDVLLESTIMNEEIFGPILPIISFEDEASAKAIIARNPNPLAFYVFTSNKEKEKNWLNGLAFGGGCVNNAVWHLTNHHLPFGGRGFSGTGQYHGKFSFDSFTHKKAILKSPTWFDPSIKYPPFKGKLKLFKWLIR